MTHLDWCVHCDELAAAFRAKVVGEIEEMVPRWRDDGLKVEDMLRLMASRAFYAGFDAASASWRAWAQEQLVPGGGKGLN